MQAPQMESNRREQAEAGEIKSHDEVLPLVRASEVFRLRKNKDEAGMSEQLPKEKQLPTRPCTVREWTTAWNQFHAVCKKLHSMADRDGDLLTIDVKLKAGGKLRKVKS